MENQLFTSIVSIAAMVVGVATVAVIVSKNANTSNVISSASSGFGSILGVALSPVTGASGINSSSFNLNGLSVN